jgi:hypothetical protein
MTFVEGGVLMVRGGRFAAVPRDEAERLAASRTPEQQALQDRLLTHFAGEAAEMHATHDATSEDNGMNKVNPFPQGTRLHDMVQDALDALADFPYTGPIPEEHVCDFGELVGPDTYRCVLRWSDNTRCSARMHGQQRVHLWSRHLPRQAEDVT